MAVKLRLMRMGKKRSAYYRVVVIDGRAPRDGRYIDLIGRYDPNQEPSLIEIDNDKAIDWLKKGAQPTEAVAKLLEISGAMSRYKVASGKIHTVASSAPLRHRSLSRQRPKTPGLKTRAHRGRGEADAADRVIRGGMTVAKGEIVQNVVGYVVKPIVESPDEVQVTMVEQGPDEVVAEVRTAKGDLGRVIGRRGRVARAIRTVAQAAAEEEGLSAGVEFVD